MILFWFAISFMTLIALGLLLFPLLKNRHRATVTQPQLEVALYRDRLHEFEEQLKAGEISAQDYEIFRQELDHALLEDTQWSSLRGLRAKRGRTKQSRNSCHPRAGGNDVIAWIASSHKNTLRNDEVSKRLAFLLLVIFPIVAIVLYLYEGNSQRIYQWAVSQKQQQIAQQDIAKFGSLQNLTAALQQHVQQTPNNPQGWYLLGKLYLSQAQYQQASDALAKANQIKPDAPEIMLPHAESLFLLHQGKLDIQSKTLINHVLQLQPKNSNAINLLALDAYHRNDYQQAINYWQKLLTLFPADSAEAAEVKNMLTAAQQQLLQQTAIKIPLEITIAKTLRAQLSPRDVVFVYAKAVDGPAMPLAVVKVQVKDLAKPVTLSDSSSMLTDISLQNYSKVKIFARISKSGQAMEEKGDFQGESRIINPKQQKSIVVINIDKIL